MGGIIGMLPLVVEAGVITKVSDHYFGQPKNNTKRKSRVTTMKSKSKSNQSKRVNPLGGINPW